MTLNTTQLVAVALALVIFVVLGRVGWRVAANVVAPVEDWVDDMFEAAPATSEFVTSLLATLIFLVFASGVALVLWHHAGDLLSLASRIVGVTGDFVGKVNF